MSGLHNKTHFQAAQSFITNDATCLKLKPGEFVEKFKTIERGIRRFKGHLPSTQNRTELSNQTNDKQCRSPTLKGPSFRFSESVNISTKPITTVETDASLKKDASKKGFSIG